MAKQTKDLKALSLGELPETVPGSDTPTLTMEEMREIQAQAKKEVDEELKAKLRADFLSKTKADMKKRILFTEGESAKGPSIERILIDLPKFSDRITLDGVMYMHGCIYAFTPAKAATIKEIVYRQWMHHAEIKGLDMNEFLGRQKYAAVVSPKSASA